MYECCKDQVPAAGVLSEWIWSCWSQSGGVGSPGLWCHPREPVASLCHPWEWPGRPHPQHCGRSSEWGLSAHSWRGRLGHSLCAGNCHCCWGDCAPQSRCAWLCSLQTPRRTSCPGGDLWGGQEGPGCGQGCWVGRGAVLVLRGCMEVCVCSHQ